MSKKSRRGRTPNLPPEAFNVPAPKPAQPPAVTGEAAGRPAATGVARNFATTAAPASVNLRREYGEVLGDLRLTAIIFIALIAVMIVLSFVIR